MDNLQIIGETQSGKSNSVGIVTLAPVLEASGTVFVALIPQPDSTGEMLADACEELDIPYVHDDADSDRVMTCDLRSEPTGDERIDALAIESLFDAIGAYRNDGKAYSRHLTMQYARPMGRVSQYAGLPWHVLERGAWNSDTNRGLIERCNDDFCTDFLSSLPGSRSSMNRDVDPAKRYLEVLSAPSIKLRDTGEDHFIEAVQAGYSVIVSGGRVITPRELCFLCSLRLTQLFRAAVEGRLTRKVVVVIEEAELQSIPVQVARAMQGLRKFGLTLILVAQNGDYGNEDNKTEIIWQNSGRMWHKCSSADVLEKAAKDLGDLIDPFFVKRRRQFFRQALVGYREHETKSETFRKKGSSETIGSRLHPIHKSWIETVEDYMHPSEQEQLIKNLISGFKVGCGIYKADGEIGTFHLPRLEEWIERKRRQLGFPMNTHLQQHNWLTQVSSTTSKPQVVTSGSGAKKTKFDASGLFD